MEWEQRDMEGMVNSSPSLSLEQDVKETIERMGERQKCEIVVAFNQFCLNAEKKIHKLHTLKPKGYECYVNAIEEAVKDEARKYREALERADFCKARLYLSFANHHEHV